MAQVYNLTRPLGRHSDKIGDLFVLRENRPTSLSWNPTDYSDECWGLDDVVMYLGDHLFWHIQGNKLREVYSKLDYWDDWFDPWKPQCTTSQESD